MRTINAVQHDDIKPFLFRTAILLSAACLMLGTAGKIRLVSLGLSQEDEIDGDDSSPLILTGARFSLFLTEIGATVLDVAPLPLVRAWFPTRERIFAITVAMVSN